MLSSSKASSGCWEIWVFAHPDFAEPVQECGLFRSERAAQQCASQLTDWLHLGIWSDSLHADLYAARDGLTRFGILPTRVTVYAVKRVPGVSDSQVIPPPGGTWGMPDRMDDEDGDEEDTLLLVEGNRVSYEVGG